MTKKKICIAMAGVVAVLAAALCACTIVPANGEYDISQGVMAAAASLPLLWRAITCTAADAIVSYVQARLANEIGK